MDQVQTNKFETVNVTIGQQVQQADLYIRATTTWVMIELHTSRGPIHRIRFDSATLARHLCFTTGRAARDVALAIPFVRNGDMSQHTITAEFNDLEMRIGTGRRIPAVQTLRAVVICDTTRARFELHHGKRISHLTIASPFLARQIAFSAGRSIRDTLLSLAHI